MIINSEQNMIKRNESTDSKEIFLGCLCDIIQLYYPRRISTFLHCYIEQILFLFNQIKWRPICLTSEKVCTRPIYLPKV